MLYTATGLYRHRIFVLYLVKLLDSANLVILVQLLIAYRKLYNQVLNKTKIAVKNFVTKGA